MGNSPHKDGLTILDLLPTLLNSPKDWHLVSLFCFLPVSTNGYASKYFSAEHKASNLLWVSLHFVGFTV